MNVATKILEFCEGLRPPKNLPTDVITMNPYQNAQSMSLASQFYQKYYNDHLERTVLFGINPGRFGGGITGVPFTDPIKLETDCGIQNPFEKKHELSSRFIYDMIGAYGGASLFYKKFYLSAISPLGYIQHGKNLNYYDLKDFKKLFEDYATEMIRQQLNFPLNRKVAYSIGQGQNLKFLQMINKKHLFFEAIITLPHPRWVMQYRLKSKGAFIQEYIDKLG